MNKLKRITAYLIKQKSVRSVKILPRPLPVLYIPIPLNYSKVFLDAGIDLPELRERPGEGTEVYRLDYFDKKKNVAIYEFVGVAR